MTYRLSTYDIADEPGRDGEWTARYSVLTKWQLREALREAYGRGYSSVSVLVEAEELGTVATAGWPDEPAEVRS